MRGRGREGEKMRRGKEGEEEGGRKMSGRGRGKEEREGKVRGNEGKGRENV